MAGRPSGVSVPRQARSAIGVSAAEDLGLLYPFVVGVRAYGAGRASDGLFVSGVHLGAFFLLSLLMIAKVFDFGSFVRSFVRSFAAASAGCANIAGFRRDTYGKSSGLDSAMHLSFSFAPSCFFL